MNKKAGLMLLTMVLMLVLAGCTDSKHKGINNEPESQLGNTSSENTESTPTNESDSLVVYFSWSGNTQEMARWIADESNSDVYRITPTKAYSDNYNDCADRAKDELDNAIMPELDNLIEKEVMAQYDTIYIGFPIWWYDLPMPVQSFLSSYDMAEKTVIPFFSHNGSSSGAGSLETLESLCIGATVRTTDVLSINGSSVVESEEEIRNWVNNSK